MIKISTNTAKASSVKLFSKVTKKFSLIQYKSIESITKVTHDNGSFDDIC